jgi:hypothetical protein
MVPCVELPLVTPFTVQVTAVLVVLVTAAVIARVPFTGTVSEVVGVVMETATAAGVGVVFAYPPQPTFTISRLILVAKTHAGWRRHSIIDPTPIKSDFLFDLFDIEVSSD